MKFTYEWLKDFVEIKIPPQLLADKLTMAGLEITSLKEKDGDFVFEAEVTANRPDCLSIIGIAREVAAITGKKLKLPQVRSLKLEVPSPRQFAIKIEDTKDCPLYTAKIIRNVKVSPSPDWLKKRLELLDCRSVNNVVDITNYILFVWGEPLHAFDLDKVGKDLIVVRRGRSNEKIVSIDGEQRMLNKDILIIADKENPVAIAGVMGGKETEVSGATKNILLEAAVFNPVLVRQARQTLGLKSESSYRFERGVSPEIAVAASWQAVELIEELTGAKCVIAKSAGKALPKRKNIILEVASVNKILGVNIPEAKIKKILNHLQFKVNSKRGNSLTVEIPSYRPDLSLEVDLIEEIARVFGYENIPDTLPLTLPQLVHHQTRDLLTLARNILTGLGLNEVITYSLLDSQVSEDFKIPQAKLVEIANPLSKEQQILRPSLLPSLLQCIAYNLNQRQAYINIFEIAKRFYLAEGKIKEELVLGIALCGTRPLLLEQGLIRDKEGFLHLKGILQVLFRRLSIKDYDFISTPDSQGISVLCGREKIGVMIKPSPEILQKLEIKNKEAYLAEIYLGEILSKVDPRKNFAPFSLYPGILRDISIVVAEEIKIKDIEQVIKDKGKPLLEEVKTIDYYKGRHIPDGFKGVTISCLYRSHERTLTEEEINPLHSAVLDALVNSFKVKIR